MIKSSINTDNALYGQNTRLFDAIIMLHDIILISGTLKAGRGVPVLSILDLFIIPLIIRDALLIAGIHQQVHT